jgi:peptidoglycan/LPS O-acetylase OafA/YrhL
MSAESHFESQDRERPGISLKAKAGVVLLGFLAIAGALLFTEHRAHVLGLLVWLPLLACPLMHIFMHHGGHGHRRADNRPDDRRGV